MLAPTIPPPPCAGMQQSTASIALRGRIPPSPAVRVCFIEAAQQQVAQGGRAAPIQKSQVLVSFLFGICQSVVLVTSTSLIPVQGRLGLTGGGGGGGGECMYSRFLILLHRHAASRSQVASHLLVYPRRNGWRERLMQRCFSRRHARPGPAARWMDGLAAQKNRLTPGSSKGEVALRKLGVCISVAGRQNGIISAYHHIDSSVKQVASSPWSARRAAGESSVVKPPESAARSNNEGGVFNLQGFRGQPAVWSRGAVPYSGTIRDSIIGHGDETDGAIGQACRDADVWELVPCSPSASIPIDPQEGLSLGWSLEHGTRNPNPLDSIFSSDHEASKSQVGRNRT
ncbi:hypothetical protein MHUMG1_08495 [Metarhizium humberi]|uniref:Uncharacterized protein n=1 Tax=Metarhizium humberi TaxID=2596975 RepID=A0A9P8S448_9HYPO|nr:hypothetical protein MHUMG1_08495 [Metarhizium humberi]